MSTSLHPEAIDLPELEPSLARQMPIDLEQLRIEPSPLELTEEEKNKNWLEYCQRFGKRNEQFYDLISDAPNRMVLMIPLDHQVAINLNDHFRPAVRSLFGRGGLQSLTQALGFLGASSDRIIKEKGVKGLAEQFNIFNATTDGSHLLGVPVDRKQFFKSARDIHGIGYHGMIALRWLGEQLAAKIDRPSV